MSEIRGTVVLDWDGICEDSYGQRQPPPGSRYDFDGIGMAHHLGYAVAVSTCNNVGPIADVLRERGYFRVKAESFYRSCYWDHPRTILVTNVKIHGWYVDDRALQRGTASPWRFPLDWNEVFAQLVIAESHPERYQEAW
jgi:hypothetical protein